MTIRPVSMFQAYAKGHVTTREFTPKAAARDFFAENPKARKCDVIEGTYDGECFTVSYGRRSLGAWPKSFKEVTRKTAETL